MNNTQIARKGYYIIGQKWTNDDLARLYKLRPDIPTWKKFTLYINGEQAESVRAENYITAKNAFGALYYLEEAEQWQIVENKPDSTKELP